MEGRPPERGWLSPTASAVGSRPNVVTAAGSALRCPARGHRSQRAEGPVDWTCVAPVARTAATEMADGLVGAAQRLGKLGRSCAPSPCQASQQRWRRAAWGERSPALRTSTLGVRERTPSWVLTVVFYSLRSGMPDTWRWHRECRQLCFLLLRKA